MNSSHLFALIFLLPLAACGARDSLQTQELVAEGREFARAQCSRCHGIGRTDDSPLEQAPPFRRLHDNYPIEHLAESFAQGIIVAHTDMPAFELESHEIAALLAYLKSLEHPSR